MRRKKDKNKVMNVFFNDDELHDRLVAAGFDSKMALQLIMLSNAYANCMGVTAESEWPKFFKSLESKKNFISKYQLEAEELEGDPVLNPKQLERILISEMNISENEAALFIKIEDEYLADIEATGMPQTSH